MRPDDYVERCVHLRIAHLTKLLKIRTEIEGEVVPILPTKHSDWIAECESLKLWLTRLEHKRAS